jgi:DNA repair exonuclease SbcCD ATPase subunit
VGVLADQALPESVSELRALMVQATSWTPGQSVFTGSDRLSQLQDEFNVLKEQHAQLSETIRTARVVSGEAQGFVDEAKIQAERLESIGLFDPPASGHGDCPLCAQHLAVPVPTAEAIQASLSQLSQSLIATERERPRLREYISGLNDQMEALLAREAEKEEAINALLNEQQTAQQLRDQNWGVPEFADGCKLRAEPWKRTLKEVVSLVGALTRNLSAMQLRCWNQGCEASTN